MAEFSTFLLEFRGFPRFWEPAVGSGAGFIGIYCFLLKFTDFLLKFNENYWILLKSVEFPMDFQ